MTPNPYVQPELIRRQVQALLEEFPELNEDEEFFRDVLEGQTNVLEILETLVTGIRYEQSMQSAIEERIKVLQSRKFRFEKREVVRRRLAMQVMEAANLRRASTTEANISLRPSAPHVVVIDERDIPEEFWRVKREPALALIKERLKAGLRVPGTTLSNQHDTLFLRTV